MIIWMVLPYYVLFSTATGSATIRADRAYSCPGMEVVFTCVVNTTVLSWDIYFLSGDNINRVEFSPSDSIGRHRQLSPRTSQGTVYTFNLASKSPLTSIMTTIASTDLSGATISCQDGISGSFHIDTLVVEILPEPPRPLNITLITTLRSEEPNVSSILHWSDSMTYNLDTFYVITLFSESNQSNFTTSNTSIWLTLFYDQDYSISVTAKNCVGDSEPAELYFTWDDQCPIPWENVGSNVSFEYSASGPRLVCNYLPGLVSPQGEIVSICAGNGTWYPNPAEIVCTQANEDNTDVQQSRGLLVTIVAASVAVIFLFLVVLSLTTTLFVTCRKKQHSRSEAQMAEETQNEYTEGEHTHLHQDEDLDPDYSSPHMELGHNQGGHHSTFTLISELTELQNSLYQNTTNDNDPDKSLNLDSLLIQLRVQVTPKWHQFGTAIGMPEDLLQQYSSYPADEQLIEVLNYWLNNRQNRTWRDVAKVLRDIELSDLAEGIMNVYETGCLPVEVDADDSDSDDNILLPLPIPSTMLPRTSTGYVNAGTGTTAS